MRNRASAVLLVLLASVTPLRADVNVLILGSTHSYNEGDPRGGENPNAFGASLGAVAEKLGKILAADPKTQGAANVVFEDVYRAKTLPTAVGGAGQMMPLEYRCYSLAQYYFWPDQRADRLANLASKGKTRWNYVVLVGDPYLLAHMPGVYAEGVNLIAAAVKAGRAKPVLVMPPTTPGGAAPVGEAVYRVGKDQKIPVVPVGHARTALRRRGGSTLSADEKAYLTAACLYSELFGRAAVGAAAGEKMLAAHALKTVRDNKTKAQFTGRFAFANPFAMKYVAGRTVTFNHTGSSTENGIQAALVAAFRRCGVRCAKVGAAKAGGGAKIDFNYGRANTMFEPQKRYKVDPARFGRSYGFPMQDHAKTAPETMLYGIDKRYLAGRRHDNGTDLGVAYAMILAGQVASDVRAVPIRLLWAKLHDANAKLQPMRDNWHMSRYLDEATAAYMVTLLTSRSPVGSQPAPRGSDAWNRWLGRKIGYETAVRMAQLCLIPPSR